MGRRRISIIGWVFLAAVAFVAVLVLTKAHGNDDYWSVAWPGVLTGAGTLALAGVTYLVLLGDQDDRRKRDEQDARRGEQERRSQASRVQVTEAKDAGGSGGGATPTIWHQAYVATVLNRSDDSVGEVTMSFLVTPREARSDFAKDPVRAFGRMTANTTADHRMTVELQASGAGGSARPVPHHVLVWLTFRDAAGVLWARDPEHRLIEITDEQARTLAAQAEKGMTNGLAPDPGPMDTSALTDEGPYA